MPALSAWCTVRYQLTGIPTVTPVMTWVWPVMLPLLSAVKSLGVNSACPWVVQ